MVCGGFTYENRFFFEFICAFQPFLFLSAKNALTKVGFFLKIYVRKVFQRPFSMKMHI